MKLQDMELLCPHCGREFEETLITHWDEREAELQDEIARLRAALTRYVDGDQCDCDCELDDAECFPCHWCEGTAALGDAVEFHERSDMAQEWLRAHGQDTAPPAGPAPTGGAP